MIDIHKEYKTKSGHPVIDLNYIPYNSAGKAVTFPIKGTVILRKKPLKTVYTIWTIDGIENLMTPGSGMDLVEDTSHEKSI